MGGSKRPMLRSSSKHAARTKRPPTGDGSVEQRLGKLREFYQRGAASRGDEKARIRWRETEDAANSSHAELLRKARAFADPANGYRPEQFEQLCCMCRKHGFALGVAAVIRLLSVPDRRQRDHLQRQAIAGHWTNERLVAEIRMRFARTKPWAGKHVRTPHDVGEALYRLGWVCNRWSGLRDALQRSPGGSTKPVQGLLPSDVRKRLAKVDSAIKSLHDAVLTRLPLKKG